MTKSVKISLFLEGLKDLTTISITQTKKVEAVTRLLCKSFILRRDLPDRTL